MFQLLNGSKKNQRGVSVIELTVAIAIVAILFVSVLGLGTFSFRVSQAGRQHLEAVALGQEMLESLRNYRDSIPWNNNDIANEYDGLGVVAAGSAFHLEKSADTPPKWKLLAGSETVNGFVRQVVIENAYRDASDNIVSSGGSNDPLTKQAIVTITWTGNGQAREFEVETYLTNWEGL
ncbi:MAG: prepilin-type N-terminal cleavage/methylation domain-containing protein [Candidatus Wildermuthbacteria bacterium]|nr:prepilin-type N-terminal cleavage/methylation domain-containing protein [Candidatus Wildermuthbacteria bacterium]